MNVWERNQEVSNYDQSHWPGLCQTGRSQSPINLANESTAFKFLEPLEFVNFDKSEWLFLDNNGWTAELRGFKNWKNRPAISGGNLTGTYRLHNIHFHWGQNTSHGSEHSVNGVKYAGEMHFVFSRFNKPWRNGVDDVHVLSVFLAANESHGVLSPIKNGLSKIVKKGKITSIKNLKPSSFLPQDLKHFYRYTGSLTAPPCSEGVIWTVMEKPVDISTSQLDLLRKIQAKDRRPFIPGNYRNLQNLNDRIIVYRT
ncbi:unnamed protein product [Bursaphelenchus xylophilus]|uniref:Carbonic anhydrase n=1 Tax=Bursaphelenchus xylophilus TaxID=6326 RepID=A0A1I7SKZ8_BURXY|nr:unnamed protein product [Bursaphelenchus xylophilus]CAG9129313.1 unnamed protein product [Bursaphelenchus xylophilus]